MMPRGGFGFSARAELMLFYIALIITLAIVATFIEPGGPF